MPSTTLEDLSIKLDHILRIAEDLQHMSPVGASQITVTSLSDIHDALGLVRAGEFRSGTGNPGIDFTGVRIGAPGWIYGGTQYSIVGLNDETLEFGLCNTDGKIYAAGGDVTIDADGVSIFERTGTSGANWLRFQYDPVGGTNRNIGWIGGTGGDSPNWAGITIAARVNALSPWAGATAGIYAFNEVTTANNASVIVYTDHKVAITGDLHHGSGCKVGFYGKTPIDQAVLATGAGHTVDDVITALQNLGLVKQS